MAVAITYLVLLVTFLVTLAYGWALNIMALIHFQGTIATAGFLEVLRVIGVIVFPLGWVLGWFF